MWDNKTAAMAAAMAQPTRLHSRFTFYISVNEFFFLSRAGRDRKIDPDRWMVSVLENFCIFFVSVLLLWRLLLLGSTNFVILSMINHLTGDMIYSMLSLTHTHYIRPAIHFMKYTVNWWTFLGCLYTMFIFSFWHGWMLTKYRFWPVRDVA